MPSSLPPHLHLLLPFALPAAADAATVPHPPDRRAFDRLIARATLVERATGEDFQRTLPHERWLARQFGVTSGHGAPAGVGLPTPTAPAGDEAPLAPYMLRADGGEPGDATWACVQPVHVHIAHDHLLLIDPATLELADDDAAALLAIARPLIEAQGVRIEAPTPHRWYLSSPAFDTLAGASPLRASGRNIEIWLPHETTTGERSRAWMKLQNEVQMAWHQHPVNAARKARGLPAVNSIWLHAQGAARPVRAPFALVASDAAATRGLALTAGMPLAAVPADFAALHAVAHDTRQENAVSGHAVLVELEPFSVPFIAQDWAAWSSAAQALERDWFGPALAALQRGELARVGLTLCGDTGSVTLDVTRGHLRRFWRRRLPASLLVE